MGRSSWSHVSRSLILREMLSQISNKVENDSDHQAAARAHGNILLVAQVVDANREAVAARARVVIDLKSFVEGHVFDFDLIVDGVFFVGHLCGLLQTRGSQRYLSWCWSVFVLNRARDKSISYDTRRHPAIKSKEKKKVETPRVWLMLCSLCTSAVAGVCNHMPGFFA